MQRSSPDIICVGLPTWEGDYMKTIVQIMSLLALESRVLYVDYPYTWKDVAIGAIGKNKTPWRRVLGREPRLRKISTAENSTVHVLTLPPVLPTNWVNSEMAYKHLMEWQSATVAKAINQAADSLGLENPVVVNAFNPFFGLPLVGKLREQGRLYYCYDEITAADWCSKHGGSIETEFIQQCDAVVTTSEALYKAKKPLNSQTFLVKNGVNFSLFSQGLRARPLAKGLVKIGYLGSVDNRLDSKLLPYVAQQFPEYQIEIVGRIVDTEIAGQLSKLPNIKLIGSQPPASLPQYLATWSAGLIPFVQNEFTKNIYPLKINEYLAAGLPVIMTPFAELSEFKEVVEIEGEAQNFVNAISRALKHDTAELGMARQQFAKQNSWNNRVLALQQVVDQVATQPQMAIL